MTDHPRIVLVAPPRSGAGLVAAVLRTDPAWSSAVEWMPRESLGIAGLAADPDVRFVYVLRDPRPAVASLVEAWRSGRFVTEPDLTGWWGEAWSFPLIDAWQELIGRPLPEIAAAQWLTIAERIRTDLSAVPRDRWAVTSYEALVADPAGGAVAIAQQLGLTWAGKLPDDLPLSPHTVSAPRADKWHRSADEVVGGLRSRGDLHIAFLAWAEDLGRPDYREPARIERPSPLRDLTTRPSADTPFMSQHTPAVAELLEKAGATLAITTYKSGHLILARSKSMKVDTHVFTFPRAMGLAVSGRRFAIGTGDTVETYWNQANLASVLDEERAHDAVYIPRSITHTGDISIHEMAYRTDGQLIFVNTRFSCLATQDLLHSFEPVWRPRWITALAAEDRCHLNGLAMVNGEPRYVSALAQTDSAHGWREHKGTAGVIVDITSDDVIAEGLAMPHSPRWYDGRLWVLQSGIGQLATVDPRDGSVTEVTTLPGFTRGLAFVGPYALIGLSQVRESVFAGLPVTESAAERNCGVWVVDLRTGAVAGLLRFQGVVQEIFDVQVLPGVRWPTLLRGGEAVAASFVLSPATIAQMPSAT